MPALPVGGLSRNGRLTHRRRPLLVAAVLAAVGTASCCEVLGLASGSSVGLSFFVANRGAGGRNRAPPVTARQAYQELSATAGLSGFQGSEWSLWTTFAIFAVSIPGVYSTIQRTGQAKFIEKTYVIPGTSAGGLEMRSIAGGVVAYFRSLNYAMEDSPGQGKIRFVGNMQGSMSQALYLVTCVAGALASVGIILQVLLQDGPFGLGPEWWYSPVVLSPWAGWYYWGRAFRKDVVELALECTDDMQTTSLSALGDKETIEALQRGVRFQSADGKLFQLMERGMEYQPGMFDDTENLVIWTPKEAVAQAP